MTRLTDTDNRNRKMMSLQRRLMWRISAAITLIFVVLALITAFAQISSVRLASQRNNEATLRLLEDNIAVEIDKLFNEITRVGQSVTTTRYAGAIAGFELTQAEDFDVAVRDVERELLRLFDDLLRFSGGQTSLVRYVSTQGRVWAQVTNRGDETALVQQARTQLTVAPGLTEAVQSATVGESFVSEVVTATTGETVLYVYVPIASAGNSENVLGVVQVIVQLEALEGTLNRLLNETTIAEENRRVLIVDSQNQIVIDSTQATADDADLLTFLQANPGEYTQLGFEGDSVSTRSVSQYSGVNTPWRIVVVDQDAVIFAPLYLRLAGIVLIYSVLLAATLGVIYIIISSVSRPITDAAQSIRRLTGSETSDLHGDDVGVMQQSIEAVAGRIETMTRSMAATTARRRRDLELASRIGREVATLYDVDVLLNRAINLIADELGFYHAQVFLVDDAKINAVLVYSRGKAGQTLLEQNFKLPVGSATVVGTVSGTGEPFIVNDTEAKGVVHGFNPLLPETRAEIGLPLFSREQIIGVLDIQSKRPDVFEPDDLPTYTLLADQLAIAIENARLVNQTNKRIQQIDTLNRQLTRVAWEEAESRVDLDRAYEYNLLDVNAVEPSANGHQPNGSGLSSPIRVRGEVIGELKADSSDGTAFTEGDAAIMQAVANRVALAIENARLFQETQTSLTETSTLYQLSRYLNEANTLEDIIHAIIVSVMPDASGGQVWLFDDYSYNETPEWLTLTTNLAMSSQVDASDDVVGLRLKLPDHAFLRGIRADQITLVNNTRSDARIDSGLKLIFRRLHAEALIVIPLNVRAQWRGLISIYYTSPRQFSEGESRLYSALSDQAGVAIDNRLLLQQTELEVARNENLYAASRIVNTAQTVQDLVYAAVATSGDPGLVFSLSLLEGELDSQGWPSQARFVARSEGGNVVEVEEPFDLHIPDNSPMRDREPEIIVDDVPSDANAPLPVRWVRSQGYRFMAIFPLFSANQPIALFHVASAKPYELDSSEYEVYRALTGQMSSQLQIRNLLQRTEAALDETRRLFEASRAITGAQDATNVYQVAVEHLARPFIAATPKSGPSITILLLMAWPYPRIDAPFLETVSQWNSRTGYVGLVDGTERVRSDQMPYAALLDDQDGSLLVDDLVNPPEDNPIIAMPTFQQFLIEGAVQSFVATAIRLRDKSFGFIVVQADQVHTFDDQYVRFMRAISDQIAIAVDNLRLVDEARFEAERAQAEARRALALAEAAQLSNRIGDETVAQGLDLVFDQIAAVAGFDRWLLVQFAEDQSDLLEAIIAHAPGVDLSSRVLYSLDAESPITDAVRLQKSLIVNDTGGYPAFRNRPEDAVSFLEKWGKHIVTPVVSAGHVLGAILMGRAPDTDDLNDRDEQLVDTLAAQVGVAFENRRLFQQAQSEQRNLRSILETLPAGMIVLDPHTLHPIQFNEQAEMLLRRQIEPDEPFDIGMYNLYRTGTHLLYPQEEMPIFVALRTGRESYTDDVAVIIGEAQIDLLVNAAPITNASGEIASIVVALQDITNLRSLENTLQENLRETVSLYEAQRQLSEAADLNDVLDVAITHLILQQPSDAFVITENAAGKLFVSRTYIADLEQPELLRPLLSNNDLTLVDDVASMSDLNPATRSALAALSIVAIATIPLRVSTRQRPFGWLVITSDTPAGIESDQERVLNQLRDVTATAIDNRILIESQESALSEVQNLYTATINISRSRDIDQLVQVMNNAVRAMNVDYGHVYLQEEIGAQMENPVLLSFTPDGVDDLDVMSIMEGYDIPPGGVYINDLERITERVATEDRLYDAGVRSFAAIYLRPKDVASGMIFAGYSEPHVFSDTEDRYLNTLADGASVVFNTFILFDQIQGALEETSTLYQASRALSDAASPDEILDVVVNYLIAPHIDQVFIAILESSQWDRPGALVEVVANWSADDGVDLQGVTLTQDQFPAWNQLATPTVLTIDDIYDDTRLDDLALTGIESLDARSLIVVPLRGPTRDIGAIWLGSRQRHRHDDRELRTYQAFAEQASLSMEASFLLQQTERRARQLETSAQVSQSAGQILDLEALMPRLVDLIKESFGYDHTQIFLMDDKDDWAELRASTGEAGRQLLGVKHKLQKGSDSVIGRVTSTGEPAIALDTADANVVHKPNPYLPLTRSEMALPLVVKGKVVGALDVQSNQPNAFNDEDVRALTTLAAQISVAIDNANLYESAQEQASQMGFLFEITSVAAAADTLDEGLQAVAERMHDMLSALAVCIYLPRVYIDESNPNESYSTLTAVALAGIDQPLQGVEEVRLDGESDRLLAQIAVNKQAFVIEAVEEEPTYLPVAEDARSAVIVPLTSSGDFIGLVTMEDSRYGAYGYDTLQLLLTLTGSLSAVVQSTQLLEQLQKTNEQLRELDRLKSDFLANMSHELRTPLNSIIGFSKVMLKGIDGPLSEMQEQDLTTIHSSGQHLLMLINDILDQAKIAAEKLDLKYDWFEIKPLVEGVKSIGIGLVKDKPIDMRLELDPNLPKCYGDELRTRQVLLNLVSNASKFTSEGAIVISAYTVETEDGRTMVRVDVADTGIGIADKDQALLFEAFRQIDSSLTRTQGGTGLGLPIAKSLTELQGGEMYVQSQVNVGSTFSITIPTEPGAEHQDEEPETPDVTTDTNEFEAIDGDTLVGTDPIESDTNPTLQDVQSTIEMPTASMPSVPPSEATRTRRVQQVRREVLLIEDDKNMVDQFRRTLQRDGYEVQTGDHPAYAEAMASNLRPNVIVMDVNFASGEGWNVLTRLKDRDDTFDIPVVVVTLSDETERAYQLGAHTVIQRPYDPDDLIVAVNEAEDESHTERILIIDDQPDDIRLLTQLLNENGTYRVFSADNGVEGISLVARRRPDLVILDLRMPEMDGFAVLHELRSNPETAGIPVLIVTGEINLKNEEQSLLSNVRVLQKTDISQEDYDVFIDDVRKHLDIGRE